MATFSNLKDLMKHLEKEVILNVERIGKDIKGVLEKFIRDDLYGTYTPMDYHRTMDFLNAVECTPVKKSGNSYSVEVFINPDLLRHSDTGSDEGWLPHTSSLGSFRGDTEYQGKDIGWWLVYWFETGDNSSPFSRGKIGMIQKTYEWAKEDNYVYNTFKARLQQAGYTIV